MDAGPEDTASTSLALSIDRIMLTNFRCYDHITLAPGAEHVVLTGPNGAGKTNLLEAISFLVPGRGFRRPKLSEINRISPENPSAQPWAVAAKLSTPDGEVDMGTGLGPQTESGQDKRIARLNGETLGSPAGFSDILQMAWLTPQMDRLFIEGTSGRRRFLDQIVSGFHSGHGREVNAYEKVMRERNRLLADGIADPAWLSALEARMAEHGVAVAAARLDATEHLARAISETASAFPKAALALEGDLEQGLLNRPAIDVEDNFRNQLAENRNWDARSGRAHIGPHRTDLKVHHILKNMPAELCSTGEQKALLIGLTLASARLTATQFGAPPVLLLDEVAAHLDEKRRADLFDELMAIGGQVWLTGTDLSLFDAMSKRARFFRVENSTITEEE